MKLFYRLFLITSLVYLSSCGKEKGTSGLVKMSMSNSTSSSLKLADPIAVTPSYFGLKVVSAAIRYVEDASQNNYSLESAFYVAPTGCTNGGKNTVEYEDKEYEVYTPPGPDSCTASEMTFLDLARTTDEVNADLNAGNYPVIPGTYNQVYICFMSQWGLKVDGHLTDTKVVDASSSASYGAYGCESTTLSDLVVAEGEEVTISLSYSFADNVVVQVGDEVSYANDSNCVTSETDTSVHFCINGINPVPSAVK